VDAEGNVTKTSFTQKGSSILDEDLINKAESAAKKFKFAANSADEQCGNITFNFQVK
jgi:hypothetical protein